jgi:hypothetical protein
LLKKLQANEKISEVLLELKKLSPTMLNLKPAILLIGHLVGAALIHDPLLKEDCCTILQLAP